jgi:Regulator of chromosome condensation (RCC1) repeat
MSFRRIALKDCSRCDAATRKKSFNSDATSTMSMNPEDGEPPGDMDEDGGTGSSHLFAVAAAAAGGGSGDAPPGAAHPSSQPQYQERSHTSGESPTSAAVSETTSSYLPSHPIQQQYASSPVHQFPLHARDAGQQQGVTSHYQQSAQDANEERKPAATTNATTAGLRARPYQQQQQQHFRSDDNLAVFAWGRGEDGQLGLGDTSDQEEPTYGTYFRHHFPA